MKILYPSLVYLNKLNPSKYMKVLRFKMVLVSYKLFNKIRMNCNFVIKIYKILWLWVRKLPKRWPTHPLLQFLHVLKNLYNKNCSKYYNFHIISKLIFLRIIISKSMMIRQLFHVKNVCNKNDNIHKKRSLYEI